MLSKSFQGDYPNSFITFLYKQLIISMNEVIASLSFYFHLRNFLFNNSNKIIALIIFFIYAKPFKVTINPLLNFFLDRFC